MGARIWRSTLKKYQPMATITATTVDGGKTATSAVTVTASTSTEETIDITPTTSNPEESIAIAVGDTLIINVTNSSTSSAYNYTISLSKSGVAEIQGSSTVNIAANNGTGTFTVTGLADGKVDINIQNDQSSSSYVRKGVIHLTVEEAGDPVAVTGVSVSPATASVEAKKTVQLTATVAPADATNKRVTWSSSNTSVATVDSTGKVRGVSQGTATITAKYALEGSNLSASCTVTVKVLPFPYSLSTVILPSIISSSRYVI